LIGYCIDTTGSSSIGVPPYTLQRLSKGLSLDASNVAGGSGDDTETNGMVFLTCPTSGSLPLQASTLPGSEGAVIGSNQTTPEYEGTDLTDYDVLSPEVLRMDYVFQVKDLSNPNAPGTAYSNFPIAYIASGMTTTSAASESQPTTWAVGDRWYDTVNNRAYLCTGDVVTSTGTTAIWTPNGMADVKAIVVAIAILDTNSRKLVSTEEDLGKISGAFLNPTEAELNPKAQGSSAAPQLMADIWQDALNPQSPNYAFGSGGVSVPAAAVSQIRIYQRYFYLNNN
jgi:hypothetical protein